MLATWQRYLTENTTDATHRSGEQGMLQSVGLTAFCLKITITSAYMLENPAARLTRYQSSPGGCSATPAKASACRLRAAASSPSSSRFLFACPCTLPAAVALANSSVAESAGPAEGWASGSSLPLAGAEEPGACMPSAAPAAAAVAGCSPTICRSSPSPSPSDRSMMSSSSLSSSGAAGAADVLAPPLGPAVS